MSQPRTLGIDIGGTSIKTSAIDEAGGAIDVVRTRTPAGDPRGERTIDTVVELIERYRARHTIGAVGIAVPGIIDERTGVVMRAVNLGWADVPFLGMLEQRTSLPITFGQDVRTGAFAEASLGAARGRTGACVFIPIGTGVSLGVVIDGTPIASDGWAGEVGQLVIPAAGGGVGVTLESVASAGAIAGRLGCATAREAAERVRRGDPSAVPVWQEAVDAIAEAVAWATSILGAEVVVIGGGLAEAGALLLDPLRAAVAVRLGMLRRPDIVAAAFGDLSTMIGAGLLAHRLARWQ